MNQWVYVAYFVGMPMSEFLLLPLLERLTLFQELEKLIEKTTSTDPAGPRSRRKF